VVRGQAAAEYAPLFRPTCYVQVGNMTHRSHSLLAWLIACYAFLYAPIGFLVALSFNDSRLVTAWDGFSLQWYVTLWHDRTLIDAALLSLRIAAVSATLALIVGTLAGYALGRWCCRR
jgi:putrescine transport system permease protein